MTLSCALVNSGLISPSPFYPFFSFFSHVALAVAISSLSCLLGSCLSPKRLVYLT